MKAFLDPHTGLFKQLDELLFCLFAHADFLLQIIVQADMNVLQHTEHALLGLLTFFALVLQRDMEFTDLFTENADNVLTVLLPLKILFVNSIGQLRELRPKCVLVAILTLLSGFLLFCKVQFQVEKLLVD